jgi:peptidoglycan/xylan/chitin deacetylase (PgdA/CDA1 family)
MKQIYITITAVALLFILACVTVLILDENAESWTPPEVAGVTETTAVTTTAATTTAPVTTTPEPEPTPPPFPILDPLRPIVALTFDDGPSAYTEQILDLMEKYDARGTFFVLGERIEYRPETLLRAVELGSEVAGHSWSHPSLTVHSPERIRQELLDTQEAIEAVVGFAPSFYRPPYGAFNDTVKSVSAELGLAVVNWSVDTRDWQTRNVNSIYNEIMHGVQTRQYPIVLTHDIYDATVKAMERIIPELTELGYQFVTVSELFNHTGNHLEAGEVYYSGLE